MSLTIVGSVAYDTVVTAREKRERQLGGSATYVGLAARRFTPCRIVAVVGEDFDPADETRLADRGIDLSSLTRVPGGATFHWAGEYSADFVKRTTLRTDLNVFASFRPVLSERAASSSHLFLANIQPDLQESVLDQMDRSRLRFSACDTMNLWITTAPEDLARVLRRVDLLTINDEESYLLSGEHNIHLAARRILQMGPNYLVIKRGEFGCALFGEGRTALLPAFPVTGVVDPTGAGDSFAGGMMGALSRAPKLDFDALRRAVWIGTLVASFTVEDFSVGGLEALTPKALSDRHAAFRGIVEPPEVAPEEWAG